MNRLRPLLSNPKKLWTLVFLAGILATFVYPPWVLVKEKQIDFVGYDWCFADKRMVAAQSLINEGEQIIDYSQDVPIFARSPRQVRIDFKKMAYQSVILAIVCGIGYTVHSAYRRD